MKSKCQKCLEEDSEVIVRDTEETLLCVPCFEEDFEDYLNKIEKKSAK